MHGKNTFRVSSRVYTWQPNRKSPKINVEVIQRAPCKRSSYMMVPTMLPGLESLFQLLLQALESKAFYGQRHCSLLIEY